MIISKTYIANPPGETIKELLEERKLTQKEFAVRVGMSEKHISQLINGEVSLTQDMAQRLEMVLGVPASFWNNLESIYRELIIKAQEENNMEQEEAIILKFPYNEMARLNWVPSTSKKHEKIINLRKFFEVYRLNVLFDKQKFNVLYRRIEENENADYALIAWTQKAKTEARKIMTSSINVEGIKKLIPVFRKMTLQSPEDFCDKLVELLAKNGIALVFLPHIGGSFLHGATFLDGNKIVIGLTLRGKYADKFWFSFFHEIGHVLLGHVFDENNFDNEKETDEFARNTLIPLSEYNDFIKKNKFSERDIISFAQKISIDYGIIVGRLQKDTVIPFTKYNSLKTKYSI